MTAAEWDDLLACEGCGGFPVLVDDRCEHCQSRCNGMCHDASEFVAVSPGTIAYAHPECSLHGTNNASSKGSPAVGRSGNPNRTIEHREDVS